MAVFYDRWGWAGFEPGEDEVAKRDYVFDAAHRASLQTGKRLEGLRSVSAQARCTMVEFSYSRGERQALEEFEASRGRS